MIQLRPVLDRPRNLLLPNIHAPLRRHSTPGSSRGNAGFLARLGCVCPVERAWRQAGHTRGDQSRRSTCRLVGSRRLPLFVVWILDGGQATFALSKVERWVLLCLALLLWLGLGESLFFLVVAGAVYRLFNEGPSFNAGTEHHGILCFSFSGLAVILHVVPGQLFPGH